MLIDLHADLEDIDGMIGLVRDKQRSLRRLKSVFDGGERPENEAKFLEDIITGANYGWNQVRPNAATYQEVLSSGKLGLIRNSAMRAAISLYYFDFTIIFDRTDERETMFPQLSYQLVPRSLASSNREVMLQVDADLSADETARLVDAALRFALVDHLIAEMNLANFILLMSADVKQKCEALIAQIETYRASR